MVKRRQKNDTGLQSIVQWIYINRRLGIPRHAYDDFFSKIAFTCVSCQTENVRTVDFKASAAFVLIWSKGVLYKIWWMK